MSEFPYEAEVQLLGYAWNPDDGPWARFRFDSDVEMSGGPHPFHGLSKGREKGQRFRIRFDLIADDETSTAEPKRAPAATTAPAKAHRPWNELSAREQACIRCGDPAFRDWLFATYHPEFFEIGGRLNAVPTEVDAAQLVRIKCEIESRKELDAKTEAGEDARRTWRALDYAFTASQRGDTDEQRLAQRNAGPA